MTVIAYRRPEKVESLARKTVLLPPNLEGVAAAMWHEGFGTDEIALALGQPEAAVYNSLARFHEALHWEKLHAQAEEALRHR